MRRPPKRLLWLLPATVFACAVVVERQAAQQAATKAPAPPRITMNHAAHARVDLLCIDCHDPEETGEPKLPKAETCFECHENLEEENERVRAYFDATRQPDGSYRFEKLEYSPDLIVNHAHHAKYEVKCADCHGEPKETAFTRPGLLELKARCMDCHEAKGASNDCAVCHREIRKDEKPANHDAAFRYGHGAQAPEGWRDGEGATCALCHEVPQSCNACHRESKPESHREAGFRLFHGRGYTDALDEPFAETSCALCHTEQSCVRCHQVQKPRNHTVVWQRRLHGIASAVERESCAVCHKQDFCATCHQTQRPVSHRGTFGRGQQTHCLACHEPLQGNGCFVCHKATLGHRGQTPPPADAVHLGASDPADCETCHTVLPHLNDGGRCRRCHR